MVFAPIARRFEIARPDAQPIPTGGRFLDPVASRGDSQALGHHGAAKVAAGHNAGRQQPVILIGILRAAIGGAGGQQLRHAITRRPAARPGLAVGAGALLRQFGRIQAQQADALVAQAKAVAITDAPLPPDRRWRLIEGRGKHSQRRQNGDGQQRPTGRAKDGVVFGLSTQDFTAR